MHGRSRRPPLEILRVCCNSTFLESHINSNIQINFIVLSGRSSRGRTMARPGATFLSTGLKL